MNRKSLVDILREGDRESLSRAWGETQAAEDFAPLPTGEYVARIVGGELFNSKTKGTAGSSSPSGSWRANTRAGNSGMTFG